MPISIHLPKDVLRSVDRRAKSLGLSRSRYITDALRRETSDEGGWSPGFIEGLREIDDDTRETATKMLAAIHKGRRSRKSPFTF